MTSEQFSQIMRETRRTHVATLETSSKVAFDGFTARAKIAAIGKGHFDMHYTHSEVTRPHVTTSNVVQGDCISETEDSKTFTATCEVTITQVKQDSYRIILLASGTKVMKALSQAAGSDLKWMEIAKIPQQVESIEGETGPKEGPNVN